MRARTFLLLFLVLLLIAAGVVAFLVLSGDDVVGSLLGRGEAEVAQTTPGPNEPGFAPPTPTPEFNFVPVLVANMPLPAGTRIEADFVRVEMRPTTTSPFAPATSSPIPKMSSDGSRARKSIRDRRSSDSMLALSTVDLASMGSDLALYVNQGTWRCLPD